MNPNDAYYISLGAGPHQKPLIEAARKWGFRVIGIDPRLNTEGRELCDLFIQESMLNYRKIQVKLMMLMLDGDIAGGFCASFGQALVSWAFIAERYNLIGLSRTQTEVLMDKLNVRRRLDSFDIEHPAFAQPKYLAIENRMRKEQIDRLSYPVIIKSRFGYAKKNVFQATTYLDVKDILSAKNLKRAGLDAREIMIEQYIGGDEITVVGLVQNFKYHLISVTDKITAQHPPFIELEHRYPSIHHAKHEAIAAMHQELVDKLDIHSAPLVSEWKVKDDKLYLVELAPQIPGEFIATFLIPNAIKYDFFYNLVALTIGEPIQKPPKKSRKQKQVLVKYYDRPLTADNWAVAGKDAAFSKVLNQNPAYPALSNNDRFGVMGFVK